MAFLFVLIELFSLSVMAEALRAHIDWKSAFRKIFTYRRSVHRQPFLYG